MEVPAEVVPLSASDYVKTLNHVTKLGLSGGVIYDALIARAAQKGGVDALLTHNLDHFRRVWPSGAERLRLV